MFSPLLSRDEQALLESLLQASPNIVLTCHTNPDGDAIGALSAALLLFERLGHKATAIAPDQWPDFLSWLPEAGRILAYSKPEGKAAADKALQEADLIVLLDHNDLSRMNALGEAVAALATPRLMIDHHLRPVAECRLTISRPDLCATCEVLFRLMDQMGWADALTPQEATALYTGMMTDTGAFTYASQRPEIYEVIAALLRTGIDKDKIYRNIFWTASADRLRLTGFLLYVKMEVLHNFHAAILTLSREERRLFQTKNGDTEGIVNMPLQIQGLRLSIFLRQDTEDLTDIHVSTRSVDDFPCDLLCKKYFQGGGHKNAAGGRFHGTLDQAVEQAKRAISDFCKNPPSAL